MATWVLYDNFRLRQLNGADPLDFDTHTFKLMIAKVAYVPNQATHVFRSSVTNEVSGSNYTAGGATLTKTLALASNSVKWDADDVTFAQHASGFADGRIAVIYRDTGSAATDELVAYGDMLADKGNVSGDLTLIMDAAGIFTSP